MKRRGFIKWLGAGAVAAPVLVKEGLNEPKDLTFTTADLERDIPKIEEAFSWTDEPCAAPTGTLTYENIMKTLRMIHKKNKPKWERWT